MRSEGYGSWLCLSVCVSVKSYLTSGPSVLPENIAIYAVGNVGQKICGVFSEFKSYGIICLPTASYSDIAAVFCTTFDGRAF